MTGATTVDTWCQQIPIECAIILGGAAQGSKSLPLSPTKTEECPKKKCQPATVANIKAVVAASTMYTTNYAVSSPVVQVYADRIESGSIPPAITVDGMIIVDGTHRHIAGLLCGINVPFKSDTAPWDPLPIPLSNIQVDTVDWGNR